MSSNTAALPAPLTPRRNRNALRADDGPRCGHRRPVALGAYVGRNSVLRMGMGVLIAGFASLIARTAWRSGRSGGRSLCCSGSRADRSRVGTDAELLRMVLNPQALWQAGGATAPGDRRLRAAGYATRRDLSGIVRALFWALIALIAFGIVAIFVQIPHSSLITPWSVS